MFLWGYRHLIKSDDFLRVIVSMNLERSALKLELPSTYSCVHFNETDERNDEKEKETVCLFI